MKKGILKILPIIIVMVVAFGGVIGAVVCFIIGSPNLIETPTNLAIDKFSGSYCLYADYQEQYGYNFVIEQKLGRNYVYLCDKTISNNKLSLDELKPVMLCSGGEYRFKVAYTRENGSVGGYSNYLEWQYFDTLGDTTISYEDNTLNFSCINAEKYKLFFVLPDGTNRTYADNITKKFNMAGYESGVYNVYITASATNYLESTTHFTFEIE